MARRSHGPAAHAVKISRGPDPSPLHFYSTNYSTHYCNRPATAERREDVARTMGTGYSANFRPAIYYSSNVDLKDNPHMIKVLADNYTSLTAQHFKGFPRETIGQLPVRTSANAEETSPGLLQPPTPDVLEAHGCSVMKRDFTKHSQTTGREGIPVLAGRVDQTNGYVKGSKHNSSVQPQAKEMILEEGRRERRERRGREETGRKELTGYSENNHPVPQAPDRDSRRFSSHYTSHFPGPPLHLTAGGVLSTDPYLNGFSKGQVEYFTPFTLEYIYSIPDRLVMERDPCYEDHTHYNKQRTTKKTLVE
ncbi:Protein phosphatase 1 regulatory subunit 32 [Geodia barretti]|uniref:Protein phosphatase 1 regulatory subunit 32 n=1 Tax=Geodia barretti TaxID=519541 RepID=A0AA35XBZ5_GEOBA|nr:Protein phosphatase 1 regulatory subunit 32 [Geodia barretti]